MRRIQISKKKIIWIAGCFFSLLLSLVLFCVRSSVVGRQISQKMAERWSEEGGVNQISCFFSGDAGISESRLIGFEHTLDNVLQEASVEADPENPNARLWTDAYSAPGMISISSERTSMMLKALGVGGDFFLFHPQDLQYGSYFSGRDLNQDYVVMDEETAWQLFGGMDVAGQIVNVGGRPHVIAGVIKRPQGKMEKQAGLSESILYVSYSTLTNFGSSAGINHYEIVMPNPIKDFAMKLVKENLLVDENEVEYVDNSNRFSIVSSIRLLRQFGYRSMNGKAIIYPYWENLARGYEDVLVLLTFFMLLFFAVPAMVCFIYLVYRWKHKKWTLKSILSKMSDGIYRMRVKHAAKKALKKKNPIRIRFEEDEDEKF